MRAVRRTLLNPLDAVRRRLTRGLDVVAADPRVRRGAQLRATVTIEDPERLGVLEVGLICTEYYQRLGARTMSGGPPVNPVGPSRDTASAVAFEAWQPLEAVAGERDVALDVPADVPFSYASQVLTYVWEVAVRGNRSGRLDAQARCEIVVLP
jgi:hypothetical protein